LLGKTTGRAGSDIDKPTVTVETRVHCDHGGRDLFAGSQNRRDGGKLAFDDGFSDILGVPSINA
jgi:hypothetical protein